MLTKWNGNHWGGEENQTKRRHANHIQINTMFASIPPLFLITKIKSFEGIFFFCKTSKRTCMIDLRGSMAYGSTIGDNNTY